MPMTYGGVSHLGVRASGKHLRLCSSERVNGGYRKLETLPQRLQSVEEWLLALVPMAEQWVTLGRLERASIDEILPV